MTAFWCLTAFWFVVTVLLGGGHGLLVSPIVAPAAALLTLFAIAAAMVVLGFVAGVLALVFSLLSMA